MEKIKHKYFTIAKRVAEHWLSSHVAERHPHFGLLAYAQDYSFGCSLAFTMAEILISLTIIGVIAAITLPSLKTNINESTWRTQRKALYSRMSQAISIMPAVNGYGIGANDAETANNAAIAFITNGLSKVLNINNICDSEHLKECGLPDKIKTYYNVNIEMPKTLFASNPNFVNDTDLLNTNTAGFVTANGESVLTLYNPSCKTLEFYKTRTGVGLYKSGQHMCANFIYDLNGRKGPNKFGKDIGFITVVNPVDSEVISYVPAGRSPEKSKYLDYNKNCVAKYGRDTRAINVYEGISLFANLYFINKTLLTNEDAVGTINKLNSSSQYIYVFDLYDDGTIWLSKTERKSYCVKK